jgi:DNA processing protein
MAYRHWVWFADLNVSLRDKYALLDAFHDPQAIYEADAHMLAAGGVPSGLVKKLTDSHTLERAETTLRMCAKQGIELLTILDPRYPDRLRNISNPPVLLYTLGQIPDFDHMAVVSLVGTRKASRSSVEIAYNLAYEMAESEILVVSGMATGIDLAANRAAIAASAYTVAVLGCGLDICYPASGRPVYEQILSGKGCLISEYPPGTPPLGRNFPVRNRILSGLSLGVLVVAAPAKSGALITANLAADQGRDVFVVPGSISDTEFAGSNELIKQGAAPVTETADIVSQYRQRCPDFFHKSDYAVRLLLSRKQNARETLVASPAPAYRSASGKKRESLPPSDEKETGEASLARHSAVLPSLSAPARQILESIAAGNTHIDTIVESTGIAPTQALAELTLLEIEGVICALPGKQFKIQ